MQYGSLLMYSHSLQQFIKQEYIADADDLLNSRVDIISRRVEDACTRSEGEGGNPAGEGESENGEEMHVEGCLRVGVDG